MNHRQITLIEVLQPQSYKTTPERLQATRTVMQPEVDAFEQAEAEVSKPKSRRKRAKTPGANVQRTAEQLTA